MCCLLAIPFDMPKRLKITFHLVYPEVIFMLLKTIANQQSLGTRRYQETLSPCLGSFITIESVCLHHFYINEFHIRHEIRSTGFAIILFVIHLPCERTRFLRSQTVFLSFLGLLYPLQCTIGVS